jgi:hypothetical protein
MSTLSLFTLTTLWTLSAADGISADCVARSEPAPALEWLTEALPRAAFTPGGPLEVAADARGEELVLTLTTVGATPTTRRVQVETHLPLRAVDASRSAWVSYRGLVSVTLYPWSGEGFWVVRRHGAACAGLSCAWDSERTAPLERYDLVFQDEALAWRIAQVLGRVAEDASACRMP